MLSMSIDLLHCHHLILKRMILLILIAVVIITGPPFAFAGIISAPLVEINSFNISTLQQADRCKWSIFVRADDLRVGGLAHGEARLINNMTDINNIQDCEIVRWSLILRSIENAAMRYPMPLIELPKEPTYNHTWDRYRYRVNDILNDRSSINDESGLFVFDSYKEEREEYDRKLEEYAKAIRTKDLFVVQKIEKTHFEVSLEMGEVEESIENYQMTPLEPFAVSLPSSMKGPYHIQVKQQRSFYDKANERMANLTYRQNSRLTYFAKITLRNGTEVELQAGDASFLPSKPEISALLPSTITVDEKKSKSWLANQRMNRLEEDEEDKDKILYPGLDATINFDQIPQLEQGDNVLLNGKVMSRNTSYEFVSIAIRLENRADPKWALDQLVRDKRSDLYEELKKRTDYSNDDSSRWFFNDDRATVSVTVPKTAASIFEREKYRIENNEHDASCDTSCKYTCTGTMGSDIKRTGSIDENGSFSIWLNISDIAAISPMDTSITHITSRLSFVLGLRLVEQNEEEGDNALTQDSNARVRAIKEAIEGWPKYRHTTFKRCPVDLEKGKKKQESATFFLKQPIGEVSISPKQWQKYDRNAELRDDEECVSKSTPNYELGPKMIRWNTIDEKEYRSHIQQACESSPSAFPQLSEISRTTLKSSIPSKDKKVEKIESTEFRHSRANRFESCRMSLLDLTRRFTIPSTCGFNTGELWAKRLLDRFKVQNSLRQQSEYGADQEQVQSVLSFQEARF